MVKKPILGKKLKNEITKYIYPVVGLEDDNFFALTVKAGSAAENKNNSGIAHFLEHVQMSFFNEKEKRYLCYAYTDFYSTTFYFDVKSYAIDKIIDLIQGIIEGRFLENFDIEKIRKDILNEHKNFFTKNKQADFLFLLKDTEYMTHLSIGTHRSICMLSKNDIKRFYETFYLMGNLSVIWLGPEKDIKRIGTKWIDNLNGNYGENDIQILDYTFTEGRQNFLKDKKRKEIVYYFFWKRDEGEETINEIFLAVLEAILLQCCGNIKIEKIYLSCQQEFVRIISRDSQKWEEIYNVVNKITLNDIAEKYAEFLREKSVGCNCNHLREQLINSFVYRVPLRQESINVRKEMNILQDLLKKKPIIMRKG